MRDALSRCVVEALDPEVETGRIGRKRRGWVMMLGTKKKKVMRSSEWCECVGVSMFMKRGNLKVTRLLCWWRNPDINSMAKNSMPQCSSNNIQTHT